MHTPVPEHGVRVVRPSAVQATSSAAHVGGERLQADLEMYISMSRAKCVFLSSSLARHTSTRRSRRVGNSSLVNSPARDLNHERWGAPTIQQICPFARFTLSEGTAREG